MGLLDDIKAGVDKVGEVAGAILGNVDGLPVDGLKQLTANPIVGQLLSVDGFIKPFVERVLQVVPQFAESIASVGKGLLENVNGGMGGAIGGLVGQSFGLVGQIGGSVVREVTKDEGILPRLFKSLEDVNRTIAADVFRPVFANGPLPKAMRGPLASLESLQAFLSILELLGRRERIARRGDAVLGSMDDLFAILELDQASPFVTILRSRLKQTLDALQSGTDTADLLRDSARALIFPFDLFSEAFRALASSGSLKVWDTIPGGFQPGDLNAWLNKDGGLDPLKREFKVRLIAELDGYLRGRSDAAIRATEARPSDLATSTEVLVAIITTVLNTTVTFILEPDCFPLRAVEWDSFEDVGLEFGTAFSRQIQAQIRILAGTMLRGLWVFSVGNENVIEGVGAIIGASLGAIADGLIRNVAWTFEIRSAYPDSIPAGVIPPESAVVVHQWPSGESIAGLGSRLRYVAFVRGQRTGPVASAIAALLAQDGCAPLRGLIQDVGAYIDVAYQRFSIDERFRRSPDGDEITITKADYDGRSGELTVWATTALRWSTPRPVLRVYVGCEISVMAPGSRPDDRYTCVVKLHRVPAAGEVTVLSNLGGQARRRIYAL